MRCAPHGLIAFSLTLILTSCSNEIAGGPGPRSSIDSTGNLPSHTLTAGLAPKVVDPVEAEPFVEDPCRAISTDQADSLNLTTPGRMTSSIAGSSCTWRTKDRKTTIAVNYPTTLTAGLSEVYAQYENSPTLFKYFEPLMISGYPALFADKAMARESGECTLNIGVTDNLYMIVKVAYLSEEKDVCNLAVRSGEAMIAAMKKGV